jgi:hypothetical protein
MAINLIGFCQAMLTLTRQRLETDRGIVAAKACREPSARYPRARCMLILFQPNRKYPPRHCDAEIDSLGVDSCSRDCPVSRLAGCSFCLVPKGNRAVNCVPFSRVEVTEICPS